MLKKNPVINDASLAVGLCRKESGGTDGPQVEHEPAVCP